MHDAILPRALVLLTLLATPAIAGGPDSEQDAVFLDGFETGDSSRWNIEDNAWSYPFALDTPAPLLWSGSASDLDDDSADFPVVGLGGDYAIVPTTAEIDAGDVVLWRISATAPTNCTLAVYAWEPVDRGRAYYLISETEVEISGTIEITQFVPAGFSPSLEAMGTALYLNPDGPVAWSVAGVQ